MSAVELKWLIRMIVKELKIGLSQASVLSVYHPDAEEFYNVNNNMEKVCMSLLNDAEICLNDFLCLFLLRYCRLLRVGYLHDS